MCKHMKSEHRAELFDAEEFPKLKGQPPEEIEAARERFVAQIQELEQLPVTRFFKVRW